MDSYIWGGMLVEGDQRCITIQYIEDALHSIPDNTCEKSKRIPEILEWIKGPRVLMLWPLGTGIANIGGYMFDLDLLPEMPGTYCEVSINNNGNIHKLVVHFEKKTIILAARLDDDIQGEDLLGQLA